MEMLNKCLDVDSAKRSLGLYETRAIADRADQVEIDQRHDQRKKMIADRRARSLERQGS